MRWAVGREEREPSVIRSPVESSRNSHAWPAQMVEAATLPFIRAESSSLAQYGGGSVALFPLDSSGKLGEPAVTEHRGGSKVVERRQQSPHPHWTGFSPDGKYALVPDLGLDQIVIYKVDSSKPAITPNGIGQSVPGGGPRHMRFSIDGKFIYLLNELSLSVTTFAWNSANGTAKTLTTELTLSERDKADESFNRRRFEIFVRHPRMIRRPPTEAMTV